MSPSALVQKLRKHCNILREDGLARGDHWEAGHASDTAGQVGGHAEPVTCC